MQQDNQIPDTNPAEPGTEYTQIEEDIPAYPTEGDKDENKVFGQGTGISEMITS
jgi:hypothetical protein